MPSAIVKLPENENVILVEKSSQTLFVYSVTGKDVTARFQAPCSTGEVYGKKQKAGDKKTPEGIYFLKDEYEDKHLTPIYGKKAFPTDYPNFIDKYVGRTGYAIWIHGTNKPLEPMDSNGCIALENKDVLKLSDFVTLNSTPVILVQKIEMHNRAVLQKQAQDIVLGVGQWIKAFENGTYEEYVRHYSGDALLPGRNWWEEWTRVRQRAGEHDVTLGMEASGIGIYHHDRIFVVLFDCFLTFGTEKVWLGKRKIFYRFQDSNYKIMGDVYQDISSDFRKTKTPLIAAAHMILSAAQKKTSAIGTSEDRLKPGKISLFHNNNNGALSAGRRFNGLTFIPNPKGG